MFCIQKYTRWTWLDLCYRGLLLWLCPHFHWGNVKPKTKCKFAKLSTLFPINILGNPIHPAQKLKTLGVWFDVDFTHTDHVSNVCRNSFLQLRDFRRIRKYLSVEHTILVANAVVALIIVTTCFEVCLALTYVDFSASKTP